MLLILQKITTAYNVERFLFECGEGKPLTELLFFKALRFLITQKRLGNKETENKKEKIGFFMFRLVIPLKLTYVKFSIDISKSSFVTAF